MDLFIDSTQKEFVASLMQDNKIIFKSRIETKYKVEEIISFFDNIEDINKIRNFYINLGPGSFTGSRIALLYIRTIAQINDCNIYATNTFELIKKQMKKSLFLDKKIYISATKNKSFMYKNKTIGLVEKSKKEKEINYDYILNNFNIYKPLFIKKELSELEPIYASNPQIGDIK